MKEAAAAAQEEAAGVIAEETENIAACIKESLSPWALVADGLLNKDFLCEKLCPPL